MSLLSLLSSLFAKRDYGTRLSQDVRMTWKVVRIDGPIRKEVGLKTEHGVVISSDAMLELTQTLLFCPLLTGDDKPEQLMPWHVAVKLDPMPNGQSPPFVEGVVSTKVVLPITLDEVDTDQKDRGRLNRDSREQVHARLKRWLIPQRT
jgi:hypothetical protein